MGLLDARELTFESITSMFANDFEIYETGEVVGRVRTEGSLGSRLMMGNRDFLVTDERETPVLRLVDVVNFGRDTYELHDPVGLHLGTLRREISFLRKRISFLPADAGDGLEVQGNVWGYDYEILVRGEPMAQISQRWAGLGRSLMGGQRYVAELAHTSDTRLRQVILGVVIAIDLMKAKDRRSSSSSSSGSS